MSYRSPGVYVDEVPPISRPIAGVSTSTPGFIGKLDKEISLPCKVENSVKWYKQTLRAEVHIPYRITSWAEYVHYFGDFVAANKSGEEDPAGGPSNEQRYLAHAVYGFFNNGGSACYVVRTAENDLEKALNALASVEEVSMVAAPGLKKSAELFEYAQNHQLFAILDSVAGPSGDSKTAVNDVSSAYAAIYYPWLKVFDPVENLTKGANEFVVPPSGHIAGIYARSDAARGAFKAPANEALLGVAGLDAYLSKTQQEPLNEAGINVIRQLNGALRVWGARTAGRTNGEYRYVSTRRYMNYLRQSIDLGTQFVVFEPHTPALWQRVIRTLSDFLTNEWRAGGLFGETAKEAFYVKCDAETNPPASRDRGELVAEIGVAIVKPAEFVIFRIHQS